MPVNTEAEYTAMWEAVLQHPDLRGGASVYAVNKRGEPRCLFIPNGGSASFDEDVTLITYEHWVELVEKSEPKLAR